MSARDPGAVRVDRRAERSRIEHSIGVCGGGVTSCEVGQATEPPPVVTDDVDSPEFGGIDERQHAEDQRLDAMCAGMARPSAGGVATPAWRQGASLAVGSNGDVGHDSGGPP
jgi:hypothetical protein